VTLETIRAICGAFPGVTEDVKWGNDLCFCVGGKMFAAMDLNPPHGIGFKCTPEDFGELTERPGVRPAPYLARAMWVQEEVLGSALDRRDFERLLKSAYDLVVAKLPKSKQPGSSQQAQKKAPRRGPRKTATRRRQVKKRGRV
jgi:predicted DNA-binding protein (MmcQ/YjbR family)